MFTPQKIEEFKIELMTFDWSILHTQSNVNSMYAQFIQVVQCMYNKYFPLQTKTITLSETCKPWLTSAVKKSIKQKISFIQLPET